MTSFVRDFLVLDLGSKMALKVSIEISLGSPDVAFMAMGRCIE